MRVLLVDPPVAFRDGTPEPAHTVPLGLALLAAVARAAGHDAAVHVAGIDPWNGADPVRALAAALDAHAPDVVGVTCLTATWPVVRRVAQLVRARRPQATVVLGGAHPTLLTRDVLAAEPAVDVVVRGEAEAALPPLLAALAATPPRSAARDAALAGIPGVVGRAAADTRAPAPLPPGPPPVCADLDALPAPAHDALLWAERAHRAAFAGVLTARGCPYACAYCAAPALAGRRLRRRGPAQVAAEVRGLVGRHGVDYLFFHDSVFTAHRGHLDAVLGAIEAAVGRLPFACQTRADCVDEAVAARLAAGGCQRVMLGVESGVPETLRRIHKPLDLDQPRRAARLLQAAGLAVSGFFMLGFPWEDAAALEQTTDYALDLGLDSVMLFAATPLPGTALAAEAGPVELPEGHDFRGPALNRTGLPDAEWRERFAAAEARFGEYNRARMQAAQAAQAAFAAPAAPAQRAAQTAAAAAAVTPPDGSGTPA
jgi:radical SAM superfamily enzyme YgiQ (UPF0313 family)